MPFSILLNLLGRPKVATAFVLVPVLEVGESNREASELNIGSPINSGEKISS